MPVEIALGDKVTVKKNTDVPLNFKGTIEKIYVNSALLTIDEWDPEDNIVVDDLKQRTVINFKNMRKGGKTVVAPKIEEEAPTNKKPAANVKVETVKADTDTEDKK